MKSISVLLSIIAVSIISLTAFGVQEAEASHFRFTHINWVQTPGTNEVTFGGDAGWRVCFSTGPVGSIIQCGTLSLGDGSSVPYYMKVAVSYIDPSDSDKNFIFGPIVDKFGNPIKHTYPHDGPFTVEFSGCCRIGDLENAPNGSFRIQTIVDMSNGNTQSPKSSLAPVVYCPIGNCSFAIPAVDGDSGDTQMFRKSTASEAGFSNQGFYNIDSNTGVITFDTSGTSLGDQYALSVAVLEKNSQGAEIGRVTVDFIIAISDQINNDPPEFVPPTPIDSTLVRAADGSTIEFDVKCTDPNGDNVTITGFSLPSGAVFSPNPISGDGMVTGSFSWIPLTVQTTTMTFTCLDENNGSALPTSIKIEVLPVCEEPNGVSEPNSLKTLNDQAECLPEGTVEGLEPVEPEEKKSGGDNQWDTRPTFGVSHETRQGLIVENGFSFNGDYFTVTDNHHTDFAEQSVEIGTMNSFTATVYADKLLKVQEFLFGIPNVGESHLAELGVEVWYDRDGVIEDIVVDQDTAVIDEGTISVSHEKTKCLSTDEEALCDTTTVSMTFLEPLADKVMAVKAIDYANRDQRTYLNDGFDISGDSLNPMLTQMIPSNVKNQGLLEVTQLAKYSPYWQSSDGRMFEMNSFGSFKEINRTFERFQDSGNAFTRMHSGFGGILDYEQNRATQVFDSTKLISDLPDSFGYHFEMEDRLNEELMQDMLEQQEIAKEILREMDKQNRHH
jgi:hypothetical protein